MSHKSTLKPLALAIGATFAVSAAVAQADATFSTIDLSKGYQIAEAGTEATCGANKKAEEGSCGAEKAKAEAHCGAAKGEHEGNCAASKTKDGNCGEGKCGADKKAEGEGTCGAEKKE